MSPAASHFVLPVPDLSSVIAVKLDVACDAKNAWPGAQNPSRSAATCFRVHDAGESESVDIELAFRKRTAIVSDALKGNKPRLFGQSSQTPRGRVSLGDAALQDSYQAVEALGHDEFVGADSLRSMDGSLPEGHRQQQECYEQNDSVIARHLRASSSRGRHISSQLPLSGGLSFCEQGWQEREDLGVYSLCDNHEMKAFFR